MLVLSIQIGSSSVTDEVIPVPSFGPPGLEHLSLR
jgi:hypothetical protein